MVQMCDGAEVCWCRGVMVQRFDGCRGVTVHMCDGANV